MHLIQIPPTHTPQVWPLVADMLGRAAEHSRGATSLDKERDYVSQGRKQLWMVVVNDDGANKAVAAGITSLQVHDSGLKSANIELFGGENMKAWFDLKDVFEKWAKDEGCNEVRLWARKGWAKHLPDYHLTHYLMRKDI